MTRARVANPSPYDSFIRNTSLNPAHRKDAVKSKMTVRLLGGGFVLLLVFAFVGLAQSATFSDSVFADSDWTVFDVFQGNGGSSSGIQATGGPTGDLDTTFREIIVNVNAAPAGGVSTVISVHTKAGAVYDPATQGAIASIDTAQDAIFLSFTIGGVGPQDPNTCPTCGPGTGLFIGQGGKSYFRTLGAVDSASWKHLAATGLTATDFVEMTTDGIVLPESHPDFSAAGGLLEFGFFRHNSTPNVSAQTVSGIDNWTVTVHPLVVPPEEQIEALIDQVEDLANSGSLTQNQADGLIEKLVAAEQSLLGGNTTAACNQLQAFINQVNAFLKSGKLTSAEAQPLIDGASEVRNEIGC